jgi:transposase
MILNGLGFVGRTLHIYPQYFKERPGERLIGKGIKAEYINDDALGRCLDKLYETILNLITENKAGIPVYMQAASGNINDNEGFKILLNTTLAA